MGYVSIPVDVSGEIATHATLTQNVHGAGAYDIQDSNDLSTHAGLSQNIHGVGAYDIADLSDLTGYIQSNSGTYIGNDTANRAIPHGLPSTPKVIIIFRDVSGAHMTNIDGCIHYTSDVNISHSAVTATDATNFYVGNAAGYSVSSNGNTLNYVWMAIT